MVPRGISSAMTLTYGGEASRRTQMSFTITTIALSITVDTSKVDDRDLQYSLTPTSTDGAARKLYLVPSPETEPMLNIHRVKATAPHSAGTLIPNHR